MAEEKKDKPEELLNDSHKPFIRLVAAALLLSVIGLYFKFRTPINEVVASSQDEKKHYSICKDSKAVWVHAGEYKMIPLEENCWSAPVHTDIGKPCAVSGTSWHDTCFWTDNQCLLKKGEIAPSPEEEKWFGKVETSTVRFRGKGYAKVEVQK